MRNTSTTFLLHAASIAFLAIAGIGVSAAFSPLLKTAMTAKTSDRRQAQCVAFEGPLKMAKSLSDMSQNSTANDEPYDKASEETPKNQHRKKGYQPIEEWDEEQKNGVNGWEDKVKFDGQKFGDQVRQNDILQQHLSGF